MDIRDWPIDRIMQLPDWCFGRRWVISTIVRQEIIGQTWDISEISFPEVAVLWQLAVYPHNVSGRECWVRLHLGLKLPETMAEMDPMPQLVPGLGNFEDGRRYIRVEEAAGQFNLNLRNVIEAHGRKLVMEGNAINTALLWVQAAVVISSLPKEVPDWLISGQGRNL